MQVSVPDKALVVVADGTKANFYRNTGGATIKLEIMEVNPRPPGKSHHAASLPSEISPGEKGEANFAAQLAHEIHGRVTDHNLQSVVIIADPQTLGQLRKSFHSEVTNKITGELHKTMTNASVADIEQSLKTAIAA